LLHLVPVCAVGMLASYRFGAPVAPHVLSVELAELQAPQQPPAGPDAVPVASPVTERPLAESATAAPLPARAAAADAAPGAPPAESTRVPLQPESAEQPAPSRQNSDPPAAEPQGAGTAALKPAALAAPCRRLRSADFLGAQQEKLTYLVSMHGLPVGNAELEARQEQEAAVLTFRLKTNAAFSSVFPVNNLIETRHIDGQFIMTKIQQQEGSFRSDEMFTINLARRRVSWVDFLQNRSLKLPLPTDQVLDSLSGIYFLRNRQLQVGQTETLHIFDSEGYAEVPVEILRREEVRLANLSKVNTLVLRPLQKTGGIFRQSGELLIWLTDDRYKVPVRIETGMAMGRVSAELISAESSSAVATTGVQSAPVASSLPPAR
jgi:hypothetical protein